MGLGFIGFRVDLCGKAPGSRVLGFSGTGFGV